MASTTTNHVIHEQASGIGHVSHTKTNHTYVTVLSYRSPAEQLTANLFFFYGKVNLPSSKLTWK